MLAPAEALPIHAVLSYGAEFWHKLDARPNTSSALVSLWGRTGSITQIKWKTPLAQSTGLGCPCDSSCLLAIAIVMLKVYRRGA